MSHVYLLVGASSGIGKATAKKLAEEGHQLYVVSRKQPEIPSIKHIQIDVCDHKIELPIFEEKLDGLVYFPGTINLKPFKSLTLEDFRHDWEINVLGAARVVQHYMPHLNEESSIVLISSVAATQGMPYHASVGSAKAALEGLTKALAAELAPKVRVNCVAPSLTDTSLAQSLLNTEKKREHAAARHPLHSIGNAQDHANAISFLLSEKARWISGQTLHVDGGLSTLRLL